jgi:S1-C subfamily serine protease
MATVEERDMGAGTSWGALSNDLANAVERAAGSVVQVQGRRRPVSGVVHASEVVLTNARALGRGDGLRVRRSDDVALDAELAGWDPATGLAVLRVPGLGAPAIAVSADRPRVGHFGSGIARSWSNAVTASVGTVAVIGGPLPTGRRRSIEEVIRTTAPMHDGFAGGAFVDTEGRLLGICTSASIRGLGVVIPSAIARAAAQQILEHGRTKRGYLGVAGQPVALSERQREMIERSDALLVVGVTAASPAAQAGLLVGDVLVDFAGQAIVSPEELLDWLDADRVGKAVDVRVLRGEAVVTLSVVVGERPEHG